MYICFNRGEENFEREIGEKTLKKTKLFGTNIESVKINCLPFLSLEVTLGKSPDFSRIMLDLQCIEWEELRLLFGKYSFYGLQINKRCMYFALCTANIPIEIRIQKAKYMPI